MGGGSTTPCYPGPPACPHCPVPLPGLWREENRGSKKGNSYTLKLMLTYFYAIMLTCSYAKHRSMFLCRRSSSIHKRAVAEKRRSAPTYPCRHSTSEGARFS